VNQTATRRPAVLANALGDSEASASRNECITLRHQEIRPSRWSLSTDCCNHERRRPQSDRFLFYWTACVFRLVLSEHPSPITTIAVGVHQQTLFAAATDLW